MQQIWSRDFSATGDQIVVYIHRTMRMFKILDFLQQSVFLLKDYSLHSKNKNYCKSPGYDCIYVLFILQTGQDMKE